MEQKEEKYLTLKEVEARLHNVIGLQQIRRYIKGKGPNGEEMNPKLPSIKFGKKYLVKEADLEAWIQAYTKQA
jgi:hypothetical protein